MAHDRFQLDGWFWAGLAGFAIFLLGRWMAAGDVGEFTGDVTSWLGLLFALWSWFRGPPKAQVGAVAQDIAGTRQEVGAMREETRAGLLGLRTEMREGFTSLRTEMQGGFARLHEEMGGMRQEMGDVRRETREMRIELAEMRRENRELLTAIRDRLPPPT